MKSGDLNFLEHSGTLQASNRTALPLPLPSCFRSSGGRLIRYRELSNITSPSTIDLHFHYWVTIQRTIDILRLLSFRLHSASLVECTVLYCAVLYCTVLCCAALHCIVLYCTALPCTVLYSTTLYCTVLCCAILYCTALYCTVLYCTVLYCTVLRCTVLYCEPTGSYPRPNGGLARC
jgi:hypothetical protein